MDVSANLDPDELSADLSDDEVPDECAALKGTSHLTQSLPDFRGSGIPAGHGARPEVLRGCPAHVAFGGF